LYHQKYFQSLGAARPRSFFKKYGPFFMAKLISLLVGHFHQYAEHLASSKPLAEGSAIGFS
jgi:hypothetical protein